MELSGRTALITGSCGVGMGRSIALRLGREGANVVLNYGTHSRGTAIKKNANSIAAAVEQLGGRALVCRANTTNEKQVTEMVKSARAEFGDIDILINNAGAPWVVRDTTKIPIAEWKSVLASEIDGPFLLWKTLVPRMRKRGWGRIIHIGMNGALAMEHVGGIAPDYTLGKAARAWMTRAFGLQEFEYGITVNCIEPGVIANITESQAIQAARGDLKNWKKRNTATSHDAAELVAFLCSEAGRFVSGSVLRLPCGFPLPIPGET